MKRSANALKQLVLEGLRQELDEMTSRVRQVLQSMTLNRGDYVARRRPAFGEPRVS
jgi:hypothetical protein